MFAVLTEPIKFHRQRADMAAFAAAQTIVADEFDIYMPSLITPANAFMQKKDFSPLQLTPDCPLPARLAGALGLVQLRGIKKLKNLKLKDLLPRLLPDMRREIEQAPEAGEEALSAAKSILSRHDRLFKELQQETYRFGSYIPKPKPRHEPVAACDASK